MNNDIYASVNKTLLQRRERAVYEENARKMEVYSKVPQVKKADEKLSRLVFDVFRRIQNTQNYDEGAQKLVHDFSEIELFKKRLLAENGFRPDYLDSLNICKKCGDTGVYEGKRCECYNKLLTDELMRRSNMSEALKSQTFDKFSLDFYSDKPYKNLPRTPRENMNDILKIVRKFAAGFGKPKKDEKNSLLFYGSPGLGKTFLSSAAANEVMRRGYTVIYESAGNIFSELSDNQFGRGGSSAKQFIDVDLLIIDDLGTEFINSFTEAELFRIINSRILSEKSMIISTNLLLNDIKSTYSERILSRLLGNFEALRFFGEDIRLKNL